MKKWNPEIDPLNTKKKEDHHWGKLRASIIIQEKTKGK